MKFLLILFSIIFLVNGSPFKPTPAPGDTDKLEAFPWIKASKAKARFGPTTQPPCTTSPSVPVAEVPVSGQQQLPLQPLLTPETLQTYIAALAAQLQPFVVNNNAPTPQPQVQSLPTPSPNTPSKKLLKGKSPKLKVRDVSAASPTTTEAYWMAEKKLYPDSLYDEFYLDWLRKRQVEEIPIATPNPIEEPEPSPATQYEVAAPTQPMQPYPPVPMAMNPYLMSPYMLPLAGFKVSKAMAQAQVNAALAALNITTTPKPVKIKLKIPIPAGSDLAQVVASGIAGFPAGTTYEMSKKK